MKPSGPSAFCRRYLSTFHFHTSVPWSPNVWGSHQLGVLQCTSILTIYLEVVASDPKAKSSVPQNCTPSFHSPGLLTDQIQTHNSLLGFTHFLEWLRRTQENRLLTRLPVYYKGIQLRNGKMEEMHREG